MDRLTDAVIADALARAVKVACHAYDERCMGFQYSPEQAAATCDRNGRCRIGWISSGAGRNAWHAWLDVRTGEGRLKRWAIE